MSTQHVSEFLDQWGATGETLLAELGHEGSRMNRRARQLKVSDVRDLLNQITGLQQAIKDGPPPLIALDVAELAELPSGTVVQDEDGEVYVKDVRGATDQFPWRKTGTVARYSDIAVWLPAKVLT